MTNSSMEHLPTSNDSSVNKPILELVHLPEVSTETERTYFNIALNDPVKDMENLPSVAEIADIRREVSDDITAHFLTTLILRLAGNKTTVGDYREYHAIRAQNEVLQNRQDTSKKKLEANQQHLEEITAIAHPYLEMYNRVVRYAEVVKTIRMGDSPFTMSGFFGEIYDRTDKVQHPALTYIRGHQQELRETSVEAERLFRLMLVNPDL